MNLLIMSPYLRVSRETFKNCTGIIAFAYPENDGFLKLEADDEYVNISTQINKYEILKNKIQEFTHLEANWDGYDGIPVLPEVGEMANSLLILLGSFIDGVSDIFPNPHGTITIEWENR